MDTFQPKLAKTQSLRQERILHLLKRDGYIRVTDLSRTLDVAEITIRRDLSFLESRNLLERTHGGAISVKHIHHEINYHRRSDLEIENKDNIAKQAAEMIKDGDTVFINGGSTTYHVFKYIKAKNIKIITINAGAMLQVQNPEIELILAGGLYHAESNAFYGSFTNEIISQIVANKAILGVHGISRKFGLTTPMQYAAETSKLMIERTRGDIIVIADHRKFGIVSDFYTAPVSRIDTIITDKYNNNDYIHDFEELGINVVQTNYIKQ